MKDIPVFTTEYGVASLLLKEIPYRETAYVVVRDVQPGAMTELLRECRSFCRMAGAGRVYVCAGEPLEELPLFTAVLEMRGSAWRDPELLANLFPVTEQTVSQWRRIYNERMRSVDNASTLESKDEEKILSSGGAYFVHDRGQLLGIGWLEDTKLLAMAAAVPGGGERVMHTLMSLVEGSTVTLEVASTNLRARKLYEKLGFLAVSEVSRWYDTAALDLSLNMNKDTERNL